MLWRPMLPTVSWAFLVLCLYAIPGSEIRSITFWDLLAADKFAHALVFMILVTIMRVGMRRQSVFPGLIHRSKWLSVLIAIAYGGILEILQGVFFIDRTPDILDFVANTIGALLGLLLFRLITGRNYRLDG